MEQIKGTKSKEHDGHYWALLLGDLVSTRATEARAGNVSTLSTVIAGGSRAAARWTSRVGEGALGRSTQRRVLQSFLDLFRYLNFLFASHKFQ